MALLVSPDQWNQIAIHRSEEHFLAAFVNNLHNKLRGIRDSSNAGGTTSWEAGFFELLTTHEPGKLPVNIFNSALLEFAQSVDWKPKANLSGPIFENQEQQIVAAQQALLDMLFAPADAKLSKNQRKKRNKHFRGVAPTLAAQALAFAEDNPLEVYGAGMEQALPEVGEEDGEDEEDDGENPPPPPNLPVSFGNLPFRPA